MPIYSEEEVRNCTARATTAANNALLSVKRAYLHPQEGAPAAFILLTCFIDYLGTLYAGADSTPQTFMDFVIEFMPLSHNGKTYNAKDLYDALRSKLVHNYSIWQGKFVLTHF